MYLIVSNRPMNIFNKNDKINVEFFFIKKKDVLKCISTHNTHELECIDQKDKNYHFEITYK